MASTSFAQIVPVHKTATLDNQTPLKRISIPVESAAGKLAYILSDTPEFESGDRLEGFDMVLQSVNDAGSANLLAPNSSWHGMQRFVFSANDLAKGPDHSAYGRDRVFQVPSGRIIVEIRIKGVKTTQLPSCNCSQLDQLVLQIEIVNMPR